MKFLNKIDGADKVNVSDNNNKFSSENVEDALEELFDKDFVNIVRNNDSGEGVLPIIPLDADTLGGRPPSYYLGGEFGGGLTEDEIKLIKVNSAINADTVNDKMVETNVPAGAKFTDTVYTHPTTAGNKHIPTGGTIGQILKNTASGTVTWQADNDTITSINSKTGVITKADIVALGIPASDTVYTHPTNHPASMITGLPTSLPADGGNASTVNNKTVEANVPSNAKFTDTIVDISDKADKSQVLTNVPAGAKFTDTVYTHPTNHPASMITGLPTSLPADGGNASTVNNKTVEANVPSNAKFTDTIVDISDKADKSQVLTNVPAGAKFTDTVYTHPTNHPASMITGLPTSLPADGGNAATVGGFTVGVNVPSNAKFTDTNTTYTGGTNVTINASNVISATNTDTITTINGKTGIITKADITALGIPASDTNTTYTGGTNVTISGTTINATDSKRDDSTSEFRLEVRTSDPTSPAIGRMWYRSDL